VLALNALAVRAPYRPEIFSLLHFLGGAAVAYFFMHLLLGAERWFGKPKPIVCYAASFALACTAAVFWEIGEYACDSLLGTAMQDGLGDTMGDLIFSALGAAVSLALVALSRKEARLRAQGDAGRASFGKIRRLAHAPGHSLHTRSQSSNPEAPSATRGTRK
jgi:hypothetical protein